MSARRPTTEERPRRDRATGDPEPDDDTSAHELLACSFGAPIELERRRQAEEVARDLGRLAERRRRALVARIHRAPRAAEGARR